MENETLRKKLAEWAGFKQIGTTKKGYHLLIGGQKEIDWYRPDGYLYYGIIPNSRGTLPAFPQSLDACFKWLVPKLRQLTISNSVANTNKWMVDILAGGGVGKLLDRSYGEAETPALAFCKAIEKLIDAETKK